MAISQFTREPQLIHSNSPSLGLQFRTVTVTLLFQCQLSVVTGRCVKHTAFVELRPRRPRACVVLQALGSCSCDISFAFGVLKFNFHCLFMQNLEITNYILYYLPCGSDLNWTIPDLPVRVVRGD